MKLTVNAPAKINLTLDIIGRRNDGYHLVKMLMQSVDAVSYTHLAVYKRQSEYSACRR